MNDATLALAWVLRRPELASAIVGATRPGRAHTNAKASDVWLTPDILAAIDKALADAPVTEPPRRRSPSPGSPTPDDHGFTGTPAGRLMIMT